MEGLQISSFNAVEDFETVAANVRVKIDTYFSQLLETIRNRQTDLISELDEILSRYRQEMARLRDKVRELKEIKKYQKDRYSSFKHLQDGILNGINSELAELRKNYSKNYMSVEFEWSQDYARDASKIGKLKERNSNVMIEDVVMRDTDCTKSPNKVSIIHVPKAKKKIVLNPGKSILGKQSLGKAVQSANSNNYSIPYKFTPNRPPPPHSILLDSPPVPTASIRRLSTNTTDTIRGSLPDANNP